jgi:hypothetical protein
VYLCSSLYASDLQIPIPYNPCVIYIYLEVTCRLRNDLFLRRRLSAYTHYSVWCQEVHEYRYHSPLVYIVPCGTLVSVASIQKDRRRPFRFCLADQSRDPGEASVTFPGLGAPRWADRRQLRCFFKPEDYVFQIMR